MTEPLPYREGIEIKFMTTRNVFLIMLIGVGCGNGGSSPKEIAPVKERDKTNTAADPKLGVFQTVVYSSGKYYLDTWACTNVHQFHDHFIPYDDGDGWYTVGNVGISAHDWVDGGIGDYPYDSLASGTFEYIKSIKASEYKRAKAVSDYEIKIGIEQRRIADSTKRAYEIRKDSVEILKNLPVN